MFLNTIDLQDEKLAKEFYGAYTKAYQACHGASGREPDEWMYVYSAAPDLTYEAIVGKWTDAEHLWIIKNGIKDTGISGPVSTHEDGPMWGVTAFVRQLPNTSPQIYLYLLT